MRIFLWCLFAFHAVEFMADELIAALFAYDPRPENPRRIVPDMSSVPAIQISHPITLLVLMEPGNLLFHSGSVFAYLAFIRALAPASCFSRVGNVSVA